MNMSALRNVACAALISFGFSSAAQAITVQEVKSPGGITAYLAEDHTTPVIAITFGFKGGSALDPDAKLGLSSMVTSLLDEGAGNLDSFAFQSELQDLAVTIRFNDDVDGIRGNLVTTAPNAARTYELMRMALTQPRFDAEPVERIRRQIQVQLASQQENPGRIARRTLMQAVFGSHPYARENGGTPETVAAITVEDMRAWLKSRFARDRLLVSAAGDITPADLGKAIDLMFGELPATTGLNVTLPPANAPTKGQLIRVEKDLPQSVIYMAQPGLLRSDPDWYIATVNDYIFGGGVFAARLMNEVREKRGLAYSVSTNLAPYDVGGLVFASVGTRADAADTSVGIIRDEWKKMREGGPTQAELDDAKQYLTGAWPLRFTSTGSIAEILLAVQRDNLGLDYIDKRNSYIDGVTLADAQRAAKKLYDPEALTVVIVGPTPPPPETKSGAKPAAKPAAKAGAKP
jgi:zinc protease